MGSEDHLPAEAPAHLNLTSPASETPWSQASLRGARAPGGRLRGHRIRWAADENLTTIEDGRSVAIEGVVMVKRGV